MSEPATPPNAAPTRDVSDPDTAAAIWRNPKCWAFNQAASDGVYLPAASLSRTGSGL
ncbi:MAG: hypothetical protein HGA19_20380 [Oscillochloris sp.]|nr:hypothetical protein [Oscillochloris sp.]